jgi:bifunctional non-homologous end joining protein LigD
MLPIGFLPPCLPIKAPQPPSGDIWLHEIKLDGFRVIARKNGERVRLYSRPGNDLTRRFPVIAEAVASLRPQSCIIDGEAVVLGNDDRPSFDRLRYRRRDASVILYAFDLVELNGDDLRHTPIEQRKTALAKLLSRAGPRIQFNQHIEEDGGLVFDHACKLGFEGIVSKRKGSPYSSGKSLHWLKSKNPESAAVRHEAEEDWGR